MHTTIALKIESTDWHFA